MNCVVGASVASVADGTVYETYDCEYFTVEYPPDLNAKRSLAAEDEGWKYSFSDPDNDVRYIDPTVESDRIRFNSIGPLDAIEGGSLDPVTQHFLDTLDFKNSDTAVATGQNITHKSYECVYFSVEYPHSWITATIPFEAYDGNVYSFSDGTLNNLMAVSFGETRSGDIVSFIIYVPRSSVDSGKFEVHVQHFIDTLHFKV